MFLGYKKGNEERKRNFILSQQARLVTIERSALRFVTHSWSRIFQIFKIFHLYDDLNQVYLCKCRE